MVKGVLFDLDGTLFDRDSAVRELVEGQHRRFRAALGGIAPEKYVARVLELDAHGHGNKGPVYRQIALDFRLPAALANALMTDFWENYHHASCRTFPGALAVLAQLRDRGCKLGVITNGVVRIQEPLITLLGLAELVDVVLISEREGVRKPHREIFERALHRLDLRAEETWHVGDHPEVDVDGAAAAGLVAVWKRTDYWSEPRYEHRRIEDLDELLPLIASG